MPLPSRGSSVGCPAPLMSDVLRCTVTGSSSRWLRSWPIPVRAWSPGSGRLSACGLPGTAIRSATVMPNPSSAVRFSGLLVSSRTEVMPSSCRDLGAPVPCRVRLGRQTEVEVGVDGVETAVLQGVRLQLVEQPDPPPLVSAEVDGSSSDPPARPPRGRRAAAARSRTAGTRTRRRSGAPNAPARAGRGRR